MMTIMTAVCHIAATCVRSAEGSGATVETDILNKPSPYKMLHDIIVVCPIDT